MHKIMLASSCFLVLLSNINILVLDIHVCYAMKNHWNYTDSESSKPRSMVRLLKSIYKAVG